MASMIIQRVNSTIKEFKMVASGEHILVGVSGGADSVALLHVLYALRHQWNLSLTVIHMDHGIRGDESKREADNVREYAREMGVPCVAEKRDVLEHKRREGLSLQEAARDVRYGFFQDMLERCGGDRVALGHHADDQAETVLMRILRGASLKGLAGIPSVREKVFIRPFINITREEIEAYVKEHDLRYIADLSVNEPEYLRNRIRHRLLPLIKKEYNPRIVKALTQMSDLLRADEKLLDREADNAVKKALVKNKASFSCSLEGLKKYDPSFYGRFVRKVISEIKGDTRGLGFRHVDAVCRLIQVEGSSRTVQLPGGWCVRGEYDRLVFIRESDLGQIPYYYSFDSIPESVSIEMIGKRIFFSIEERKEQGPSFLQGDCNTEYLNYDEVTFPLIIRTWEPGDWFHPLGLAGTKKLKKYFSDNKVPVRERHTVPLLLFGDRIAWVCGLRIDERFKVKPDSKRVLKVWIE